MPIVSAYCRDLTCRVSHKHGGIKWPPKESALGTVAM
jgi:hypothetical protein